MCSPILLGKPKEFMLFHIFYCVKECISPFPQARLRNITHFIISGLFLLLDINMFLDPQIIWYRNNFREHWSISLVPF